MSRDALFQLGIVPVSLNTTQTEDTEVETDAKVGFARDMGTPFLPLAAESLLAHLACAAPRSMRI